MRKISFPYLTIAFLAMVLNEAAWADRSHNYYRSHTHSHGHSDHSNKYNFSLGLGLGYGASTFGYYGGRGSGFYGSYSFGYPYYYRPYYGGYALPPYYPPVVVVPATPPVYIQQPSPIQSSPPPQTNYWHYCENPSGYYPYVRKCPGGWLKVAPQPAE